MLKYKRGEHDLRKIACSEYCKRRKEYCPISKVLQGELSIERWTNNYGDTNYSVNYEREEGNDTVEINLSPCSCWGDGSGFEYDTPTQPLIGTFTADEGFVFDIYKYAISHKVFQQHDNSWNAWIEKFQPDYRFGRVSDTNSETILFPNITNPWMFTEYVFKGETSYNGGNQFIIIEPPLYDPEKLELINYDSEKISDENKFKTDYDGKYKYDDIQTIVKVEELEDGSQQETKEYGVKQYRLITNWNRWYEEESSSSSNSSSSSDSVDGYYPVKDAGVKLYRANVNVQCVKWGEHGNIPPHTLDMTAPADYLDPTKIVSKIKAVTTAVIGSPLYANAYGVLTSNGQHEMFIGEVDLTKSTDENGHVIYTYPIPNTGTGIRQDTPPGNGGMSLKPEYAKSDGYYVHGGCELCKGDGGILSCQKMSTLDKESDDYQTVTEKFNNVSSCLTFNNKDYCPFYIASKEYPVIATYQKKATNMADYFNAMGTKSSGANVGKQALAENILNNSTGLPSADMFVAAGIGMQPSTYVRNDNYLAEETEVTFITEFKTVTASLELPKLNKEFKEFGKGVQIIPDTGKFALDTRENHNLFGQDELNLYGDISPLSFHRFFASVMHCATQANCNEYCGLNQKQGFSSETRAGGAGKCRYYIGTNDNKSKGLHGCPYTGVPKRAVEFSETMQLASPMLISLGNTITELSGQGFWDDDNPDNINYQNLWEVVEKGTNYNDMLFTLDTIEDDIVKITVYSSNDVSSQYGGIAMKDGKHGKIVCYMKGKESTVELKRNQKSYSVRKTQITDVFFYYKPLDDNGGVITKSESQHVDDDGLWLCKADLNFVAPTTNCVMIDNEKKFLGGYHPQYKDYGASGGEFIQEVESDYGQDGSAMGDKTNYGDYSSVNDSTIKRGYWIDACGQYIMDERSTGIDKPIADDATRESTSGPATCISFKKSNTEIDPVTGKRTAPKTTNGAVYANDSYNVIQTLKSARQNNNGEITGRPMFDEPDSDKQYYAPLICRQPENLPTMRKALHCPKCDYYIAWKYKDQSDGNKCPWCGEAYEEITGCEGPYDSGETWDDCLKPDEETGEQKSVIKKFFKLYAIGQVQVWGPPGTCVHTDAYFWRHQAVISNAIKRQIYHRLGDSNYSPNSTVSGGYSFNKMSRQSEFTLGYTDAIGYYKKLPNDWNDAKAVSKPYHKSKIKWDENRDPTKSGGYNGIMPKNYMPYWKDDSLESVIAPYAENDTRALKLNSYEQMRVLRNAVEPVMAYISDSNFSLSQNDYPTIRASYEEREKYNQNIVYRNRRSTISPVVLAYSGGQDAWQEFYSGDMGIGNVREYFPPGYTWWFLKQTLGGRYTNWTQGQYHMDGGSGMGFQCRWPTSTQTIAKCAMFLHGVLPLDKDILAAYILIGNPGPEPSKDPIGKPWNGSPNVMYHHYHAKRKAHYGYGSMKHLHGSAGEMDGIYYDEDGNMVDTRPPGTIFMSDNVEFQDYSDYRLWGSNNQKESEYVSTIEDNFFETMTSLSAVKDISFYTHVGAPKDDISINGEVVGKGYIYKVELIDKDGKPYFAMNENLKGLMFQNCVVSTDLDDPVSNRKYQYCVVKDGEIIQSYPDELIWKTSTTDQLNTAIKKGTNRFEFGISDGTKENSITYTFTKTDEELYGKVVPNNSQGITGYFDMSWTNTTGTLYGKEFELITGSNSSWDYPVIFQDQSVGVTTGSYGGTSSIKNIGNTMRCIDVTSVIKSMYNDRISRTFHCIAGNSLSEVGNMKFPTPKVGGTLTSVDADILSAQTKTFDDGGNDESTYLLTDSFSYPEMNTDGSIPSIDPDGGKYPIAKKKIILSINIPRPFPIKIYNSSSYYVGTTKNKYGREEKRDIKLGEKTIRTMTELSSIIKTIIPGATFTKKSNTTYEIMVSADTLVIPSGTKYVYGTLGIPSGTHISKQSRIISCSSYVSGNHPDNLFYGGTWTSNSFTNKTQNFVVDLVRTPLLLSQKNYRYKSGSADYSNCKCPVHDCTAHTRTCAIAANRLGKKWDSSQPYCPEGHSLAGVSGVISEPGDGIMTYEYAPLFSENPFIKKIKITPLNNCKFSVAVKSSTQEEWRTIANGESESVFSFDSSNPDKRIRARYVRVSCTPNVITQTVTFNVLSIEGYSILCYGDFSEYEGFSFVGLKLISSEGGGKIEYDVVSEKINDNKDRCIFYVNKNVELNGIGRAVGFVIEKYVCGITDFKVYGFHYMTEYSDGTLPFLTITDMEDMWYTVIDTKNTKYTLGQYPSKIYSVEVCKPGEIGIVLTETEDKKALKWQTEEKTSKKGKYRQITGGNYYYDPYYNRIILPKESVSGEKWGDFEKDIRGSGFSYLPTRLVVRFFSGNGKTITLKAEANGNGPSYQLEKDAIQVIEASSKINMEDCGNTGKMIDVSGNIVKNKKIEWNCYNELPCTLSIETSSKRIKTAQVAGEGISGEFRRPNLVGNEIANDNDDNSFVKLFGDNQSLCIGKCQTDVVFTGTPNRIIHGVINVTAKDYTDKTIQIDKNTQVTIKERTGGLRNGCFIVKCPPADAGEGLCTETWKLPKLLIYAKERKQNAGF